MCAYVLFEYIYAHTHTHTHIHSLALLATLEYFMVIYADFTTKELQKSQALR